jgi:hypothetical protein
MVATGGQDRRVRFRTADQNDDKMSNLGQNGPEPSNEIGFLKRQT